jgi:hypothetical protein
MRRFALALVTAALVGCSTSSTAAIPATPTPRQSPSASAQPSPQAAQVVAGGCGTTPLLAGGIPGWLEQAGAHNNPSGVTYAVASPVKAAGFLFGYPLAAGRPQGNKILWVVGLPRNGSSLDIRGHPLRAVNPSIHLTFPANSSPGEIYPSGVDVPKPGCWHFDLAWDGHKTSIDLKYA